MKVAIDIGGVVTRHPAQFRELILRLESGGAEVYFLTDIPDTATANAILERHGIISFPWERILCADYHAHGGRCKSVLVKEHGIDVLIDDHAEYCADSGCLSLFVWPDPNKPYDAAPEE